MGMCNTSSILVTQISINSLFHCSLKQFNCNLSWTRKNYQFRLLVQVKNPSSIFLAAVSGNSDFCDKNFSVAVFDKLLLN